MSENKDYIVLNWSQDKSQNSIDPLILSKKLIALVFKLKGENFIDEKQIDYKKLIQSELYKNDLHNLARMLKDINLDILINDPDERKNDKNLLVFFINIYNSLTIHSICYLFENNMISSSNVLNLVDGQFWSRMAYKIGEYNFSLDDIEHGILRCNRVHPSKKISLFSDGDPRIKFCIRTFDPRIHFALNCGAKGCPPIAFYTIDNLDRGLKLACSSFCTNETEIIPSENKMVISRLFLWYGTDFVENPHKNIIAYVSSNFKPDDEIKKKFDQLNSTSNKINIEYSAYDWELNIKI